MKWFRLAVPTCLAVDVLRQYHDLQSHLGTDRLLAAVRSKYYFHRMYSTIRKYVKSCQVCQRTKRSTHFRKAELQPLPSVDLFQRFHMDFLGPLPESKQGNKYILLLVESLSRWPIAVALPDQTAKTVAKVLYEQVITTFGCPLSLLSDRGSSFCGELMTELSKLLQIKRLKTSGYHPETNAACERQNGVILQSLKAAIKNQNEWEDVLPAVMAAYRATPCVNSTEFSPFFCLYGQSMRLPLDNDLIPPSCKSKDAESYINKLIERLTLIRRLARENVERHQERYKARYDAKAVLPSYKLGDKVWLYSPKVPKERSPKLWNNYWQGPYYICEKVGEVNYTVRHAKTHKRVNYPVHVERLKPCIEDDLLHIPDDEEYVKQSVSKATLAEKAVVTDGTAVEAEKEKEEENWFPVNKVLAVKTISGKKYYKVEWLDNQRSKTWEPEENLPDNLKQEYHVKRTQTGKLRRKFKKRKINGSK